MPTVGEVCSGALCPVTALRTQVFFRNEHFRDRGFWIGASGIHCADKRYTSDSSMPHLPQVYTCVQHLDLKTGVATTSGTLALSSSACVWAGTMPEREIAFQTRVMFLKDSPLMGVEIEADAEILFVPEPILHEVFSLKSRAKGILRLGNEIDCHLEVRQEILERHSEEGCITYTIKPNGHAAYRVRVRAPGCRIEEVAGLPGLLAEGRMFFQIEILPEGHEVQALLDAERFEAEQAHRWAAFWDVSDVCLPAEEALWQQRYRASLFYVAQSMGRGAVQPVGLSKPMLPYWVGCFHDTDTYFCRPLLESGRFEEAYRNLAYRQRGLESARRIAVEHRRNGAFYPWQADSKGNGSAGDVPMNSAIIACEAWHQFLHSGAPEALVAATEIVVEIFVNLCDLLDFSGEAVRVRAMELMTFSETMVAEDPAEVRLACRATAAALLAASKHSSHVSEWTEKARRILDELDLPLEASGGYRFCPQGSPEYLRCPSVTLGSFPLHHLPADAALEKTSDDELARTVFLFAWLPHQASVVASQLGRREGPTSASELLRGADAFYKPWHAYDEWENRRSARAWHFVTAAGGFCTAIHHMLAAETGPGIWSLFAATPTAWRDVSFRELRLRCGWTVSAGMENGVTVSFEVRATHVSADTEIRFHLPNPAPALVQACSARGGTCLADGTLCVPAFFRD